MTVDEILGAVIEMKTWATRRIEECRRQELKFAHHDPDEETPFGGPRVRTVLIEASQERRTLQAVLAFFEEETKEEG